MPEGSWFGLRPLSDSSDVQTKTPELPAFFSCRHCSTSSKLVYFFWERQTPMGLPVQCTEPSFLNVQVSLSQLTLTKSSPPSAFQPGPVPSMNALGGAAGLSAGMAAEAARARQTTAGVPNRSAFMSSPPGGRRVFPGARAGVGRTPAVPPPAALARVDVPEGGSRAKPTRGRDCA